MQNGGGCAAGSANLGVIPVAAYLYGVFVHVLSPAASHSLMCWRTCMLLHVAMACMEAGRPHVHMLRSKHQAGDMRGLCLDMCTQQPPFLSSCSNHCYTGCATACRHVLPYVPAGGVGPACLQPPVCAWERGGRRGCWRARWRCGWAVRRNGTVGERHVRITHYARFWCRTAWTHGNVMPIQPSCSTWVRSVGSSIELAVVQVSNWGAAPLSQLAMTTQCICMLPHPVP